MSLFERNLYSNWTVPGSEERVINEAKACLAEASTIIESANKATTRAEVEDSIRKLKAVLAKLA